MPAALQAVGPREPVSLGSGETASGKSRPCSWAVSAACAASASAARTCCSLSFTTTSVGYLACSDSGEAEVATTAVELQRGQFKVSPRPTSVKEGNGVSQPSTSG